MALLIMDKVLSYGAFKVVLDQVVEIIESDYSSSFIIRGNAGSGKKTIIAEARKRTNATFIILSSYFYNDDYTVLKEISHCLGFEGRGSHIDTLMQMVTERSLGSQKLVLVLLDFEEFCRKNQTLLYNLLDLIHRNPADLNLTLIGLTSSLDWGGYVEKRVRSRLNAKCINLSFPYGDLEQFVEFTSELLDGEKIDEDLRQQLTQIYYFSNRSIRTLKKFLYNICYVDAEGKLKINFNPADFKHCYQLSHNNLLKERLRYLTKNQLDLMKIVVLRCSQFETTSVTVDQLDLALTTQFYQDLALLMKLKLLKSKNDQSINGCTILSPATTARQFNYIIANDITLQNTTTDYMWKQLKG